MTTHALYLGARHCFEKHVQQLDATCAQFGFAPLHWVDPVTLADSLLPVGIRADEICIAFVSAEQNRPVRLARQLRTVLPEVMFLFLVDHNKSKLLHDLQSPVSGVGANWEVLDYQSEGFGESLNRALHGFTKKRKFRTTLSGLNQKLQQNVKPALSEWQRYSVSLHYLDHIVDHAHDGIVATTNDGVIVKWNKAASAILKPNPPSLLATRYLN